jgi:hypothetical protein
MGSEHGILLLCEFVNLTTAAAGSESCGYRPVPGKDCTAVVPQQLRRAYCGRTLLLHGR